MRAAPRVWSGTATWTDGLLIYGALAEFERERIRAGLTRRRKRLDVK